MSEPRHEGIEMARHSRYDRDGGLLYMEDALSVPGCTAYDLLLQEFINRSFTEMNRYNGSRLVKKVIKIFELCLIYI